MELAAIARLARPQRTARGEHEECGMTQSTADIEHRVGTILMDAAEFARLEAFLRNPPEPTEALIEACRLHRALVATRSVA